MHDYTAYFRGKRVTLMGLGLLGRGVGDARFLAACGAELTITDKKTAEELASSLVQLQEFPHITFHLGEHRIEDFQECDLVVKAAGVPLDSPYIAAAHERGIPVRMSADLFVELSGVYTVGVTGTRGKSTVAYLIAHLLRVSGKSVLLGGNVQGVSTLALLPQVTPETIAVLELDSWQLQGFKEAKHSPQVAVFTTFMPDHMNYYGGSMEKYFADKAQIFLNQTESDTLVIGSQAKSSFDEFGYTDALVSASLVADENDLPEEVTLQIPGEHNRYNAGIASAAARVLGVREQDIRRGLETFIAVPGRLQFASKRGGVSFYNDTNSTVPQATLAALRALGSEGKKNIILIMGGSDKGLDMSELLLAIPEYTKSVELLAGTGTERIGPQLPEARVHTSMRSACEAALAAAAPGDVVLMSPAFASFGMFANEYDRGAQFDAFVDSLV